MPLAEPLAGAQTPPRTAAWPAQASAVRPVSPFALFALGLPVPTPAPVPTTALRSRLGGWPGWLQSTRIADFDTIAFQVDSLDVAGWSCGDSTMHYFFRSGETGELSWHQDTC